MNHMCPLRAAEEAPASRTLRLRYAGRRRACGADRNAGTTAAHDRAIKTVAGLECALEPTRIRSATDRVEALLLADPSTGPEPGSAPPNEEPDVVVGAAGGSAQREYERRENKRQTGIREAHPRLGGQILALSDDLPSTKAWAVGARGEELPGKPLDGPAKRGVRLLHDRRIPVSPVITLARHAQRLR